VRLSRREIFGLGFLILITIVFTANRLIYEPFRIKKDTLRNERSNIIRELEEVNMNSNKTNQLNEHKSAIEAAYQLMDSKVPSGPMIFSIINMLESYANQSNVRILSLEVKPNDEKMERNEGESENKIPKRLKKSFLQINVAGTYFNLLSFLIQIENSPRLMMVDKVAIGQEKNWGRSTSESTSTISGDVQLGEEGVKVLIEGDSVQMALDLAVFYRPSD
jgi:Tfp pilus assembly protein PilO